MTWTSIFTSITAPIWCSPIWAASIGSYAPALSASRASIRPFPVIGDALAKFRRDLKVFQTVEIHTRLLGWDERWGFLEHRFVREGRVIGVVADLPEWAVSFQRRSELLSDALREEERRPGARAAD
jgi:Thioesterase-like superfamily